MSSDDCQLSDGVTYEALPENEFTRQIPSFSRGFVRLQPYNQVRNEWIEFVQIDGVPSEILGLSEVFPVLPKEAEGV